MRNTSFWAPLVAIVLLTSSALAASALQKKYRGQIVASDQAIAMDGDEAAIADALKKGAKTTIERSGSDPWTVHFVGFLSRKPGTDKLQLMIYDASSGKRVYLTSKEISVEKDATILASSVELSEDDGVKPGMKAELVLASFAGKQADLAKVKLTFK